MIERPDDWYCPATSKQTGKRCGARAGSGTDHVGHGLCRHHGGRSPGGKKQAQRSEARHLVAVYGLPVTTDPAQALLDEIARTAGHVAWLGAQIERIGGDDPDNLIRGTRSVKRAVGGVNGDTTTTEVGPAVHLWLQLYQQERKHLVGVCAAALHAGVEERRVQLAEQQGQLLASGLAWFLDQVGLTGSEKAREALGTMLRALDQGVVPGMLAIDQAG